MRKTSIYWYEGSAEYILEYFSHSTVQQYVLLNKTMEKEYKYMFKFAKGNTEMRNRKMKDNYI